MIESTAAVEAARPTKAGRALHLADFTADPRVLMLTGMALIVGTGGAVAAWVLLRLIALVTNLAWFGRFAATAPIMAHATRNWWMFALPPLGGLIVGLIARYGSEKIRGHGIPEAIEAILIGGSRMSPKVALLKPLSSAIAIGTGGPFGAEGPIIMTGGAMGSLFAQFFHLSAAERKTLLVAGAAAGMTGIFGTPTAAILLAVELLLFEWRPRSFIPVAAAAITAICWRPLLLGAGPLFASAAVPPPGVASVLAAVAIGLVTGLFSGLLTRLLYAAEDAFHRLPIHWMWWPAIGGLAVGVGGLIEPRALGVGYDVIDDLLNGRLSAQAVALILGVKAAIWLIALSSGTSGGVLAPLLILGGAAGSLMGMFLPGSDGTWALLGMAAMLGGTMRAPLTSAAFAVEITGDLSVLVPVLASSVVAYAVTVLLMKRSILTEKIARRGQHITREYGIDPYEFTRVADVMIRQVDVFPADMSVGDAVRAVRRGPHRTYPVIDQSRRPIGMVSRADVLDWEMESVEPGETLSDRISDASLVKVHPDDVATRAVDAMLASGEGRLAVVDRSSGVLVGLLTRKDLLQVRAAVTRTEDDRATYFRRQRNSARR